MTLKPKQIVIALFMALACFGLVPVFASAQVSPKATPTSGTEIATEGLVICGQGADQANSCTLEDLFSIFARVINFLLAVAGLFAIFQIVRAGQAMVLAFGNPESLTTAKNSLTNAVLGFALVMIAYLLVYFVVYAALGIKEKPQNLFFHPIEYLQGIRGDSGSGSNNGSGGGDTTIDPPPTSNVKVDTKLASALPIEEEPCDTAQNTDPAFPWVKTARACAEPGDPPPVDANCDISKQDTPYFSIRGTGLYFVVSNAHQVLKTESDLILAVTGPGGKLIVDEHYPFGQSSVRIDLPALSNGTYRFTLQEAAGGRAETIATLTVDTSKTLADCPGAQPTDPNSVEQPVGTGSYPPSGRCLAEESSAPREKVCTPPQDMNPPLVRVNDYVPSVVMKDGQYVHPGAIAIIKKINDRLNFSPSFRVTEAYPPYAHHESVCHYNGRCIDISPFPGALERREEAIRYFILYCRAIKAAGITSFANETGLTETVSECGALKTFTFTNGAHIHLILHK